ncbi:MAG: hypothetical protein ABIQ62_06135, partial [Thermomonas sp.]
MSLRPLTLAIAAAIALTGGLVACQPQPPKTLDAPAVATPAKKASSDIAAKVASYAEVELKADLSKLSEGDRQAIVLLLQAGQ